MKRPAWTTFFTIPLLPSSEFSLSYDICYKFMALFISVELVIKRQHIIALYKVLFIFSSPSAWQRRFLPRTHCLKNIRSWLRNKCCAQLIFRMLTLQKEIFIPSKPVFQEHDRKCLVLVNSRTFDIHPKVGVSSSPGLRHFLSQNTFFSLNITLSRISVRESKINTVVCA